MTYSNLLPTQMSWQFDANLKQLFVYLFVTI